MHRSAIPAQPVLTKRQMRTQGRRRVIRSRAVHEAGHACLMWRGNVQMTGDDDWAPFDEIVISGALWDEDGNLPPMVLSSGELYEAAGTVITYRGGGNRLRVPIARRATGGTREGRLQLLRAAKLAADQEILVLLAGPLAEAVDDGADYYDWWDEWCECEDEPNNDIVKAYAIARDELCRSERLAQRYMDDAMIRLVRLFAADLRHWRTINAVADRLARWPYRLDHDQAVRTMRRAWNLTTG